MTPSLNEVNYLTALQDILTNPPIQCTLLLAISVHEHKKYICNKLVHNTSCDHRHNFINTHAVGAIVSHDPVKSITLLVIASIESPEAEIQEGGKRHPAKVRQEKQSSSAIDWVEHSNGCNDAAP